MPTVQLPHRNFEDIKSQRNFEALERYLETIGQTAESAAEPITTSRLQKGSVTPEKLAKPEAWKLISSVPGGFKNAWVDLEAGNKGEYRKDALGMVEMQGGLKGGEPAKEAFTLPEKYRPKAEREVMVAGGANTSIIRIHSTGVVEIFELAGNPKVSVYLNQVRFSVE